MPQVDLERRLSAAFDAVGEPELTADQRGALVPALRRRRARRQRLASGVGALVVVAGLAAGLGLGLGSAPLRPVALPAAPTTCVEVQIGASQSCRGTLVVSSGHGSGAFAAPLAPAGTRVPASAGLSAPNRSAQPVGVMVGARLVIALPRTNGVRWSRVRATPQTSSANAPVFSATEGGVTTRTTRTGDQTVATVTAVAPGTVVLSARGETTCPAGETGCVVRSVTWSWVLRVAAPATAPGTP